jgi:integrase/recombinase XerC
MHTVSTRPTSRPSQSFIDRYLAHLRTIGRSASTIGDYGDVLRRIDREVPAGLASAHSDELSDWIFVDGRRPATRAVYRAACVGFFAWATDPASPVLDFDPTRWLPKVKVPARAARPIPTAVLADILARANPPFRTWYLLASGGGLRCCEIAALDREHVTDTEIWVQGKGGRERLVPTHPAVWAGIRGLPAGPVARTARGRATRQAVAHRGNRHLQYTLGYQGVSMHRLRHWYGTHVYAAAGGDVLVAKELLGHAFVSTTQVYVEVAAVKKQAAAAALPLPTIG